MEVDQLSPHEWRNLSESAHLVVFNEKRDACVDRIDYALIVKRGSELCGYVTVRELDFESVYWQFGGALPDARGTAKVLPTYMALINWSKKQKYRRINTLVENTNKAYLKLAAYVGFTIMGIRTFKGIILLEHMLNLDEVPNSGD